MAKITIKAGNTQVTTTTEELIEVNETPEGVVFDLKGGLTVLFTDFQMLSAAKQIIKNTADRMRGQELIFEPGNPKIPAIVIGK